MADHRCRLDDEASRPGTSYRQTQKGRCEIRCNRASPPPGGTYGAIAHGWDSRRFGYAQDESSASSARSTAARLCGRRDCKVAITDSKACAAVSVGDDGTIGAAERAATADCRRHGGVNCEVPGKASNGSPGR